MDVKKELMKKTGCWQYIKIFSVKDYVFRFFGYRQSVANNIHLMGGIFDNILYLNEERLVVNNIDFYLFTQIKKQIAISKRLHKDIVRSLCRLKDQDAKIRGVVLTLAAELRIKNILDIYNSQVDEKLIVSVEYAWADELKPFIAEGL